MRPYILAITASQDLGQMLSLGLPLFGFRLWVVNAADSVEAVQRQTPDVVLLEIPWNNTSHFDLCDELRVQPGMGDVPIIFITTDIRPARWVDVLMHGGDDLVLLPVQFTLLADRLQFHLGQARWRSRRGRLESLSTPRATAHV